MPRSGSVFFPPTASDVDGAVEQMYDVLNLVGNVCVEGGTYDRGLRFQWVECDGMTVSQQHWAEWRGTKERQRHNVDTH